MNVTTKTLTILATATAIALTFAGNTTAQKLRRAIAGADVVLLGKVVRVIPTAKHVIHRVKIKEILRGQTRPVGLEQIAIVETKRVSQHNKPTAARLMLLCLHRIDADKTKALPKTFAPYYKMSGYPGSSAVLDADPSKDARLAFARTLVASQGGQAPRLTTEQLFKIATGTDKRIRIEAANSLAERKLLAGYLHDIHISRLLTQAAGETEDIPYKIALATVCAERKVPELIPTLCVSAEHVGDPAFLKALGRFARYIHKDKAGQSIMTHLRRARGKTKDRLIVALGATSTEGALTTLLEMQRLGQNKTAVDAALRAHGSRKAAKAIARKRAKKPAGKRLK